MIKSFTLLIITLFESQIILAEHEWCTNWGDCKSNKSNQIKCWFLRRGENRSSRRKTSRIRVENQQTQPTYDAGSGNRTRDTLVEGERSHHYTNPTLFEHRIGRKKRYLSVNDPTDKEQIIKKKRKKNLISPLEFDNPAW